MVSLIMYCLFVSLGVVGLPKQVIYAHLIVIRQLHQQFVGKWLSSRLNVAVFALGYSDGFRDLLLGQIRILPQVLDPVVQSSITTDSRMPKI